MLANRDFVDKGLGPVHLVSHSSSVLRRVVRATFQAETYRLQLGVESGDLLRAALADMHGILQRKHWETTAAAWCHMAWYTVCDSTVQALLRPVQAKIADKRSGHRARRGAAVTLEGCWVRRARSR